MNTENVSDKLETMILMALDANSDHSSPKTLLREKSTGAVLELHDQGTLINADDMRPNSSYTFDVADDDRIFATTTDYLITHPSEVIGDEAEVIMLHCDTLKWYGYRRLRRPPKNASCLGKPSHWYESHTRYVSPNSRSGYVKRLIAIDSSGRPLLVKMQGHVVCNPNLEGVGLILCSSIIEDAHRTNTMLATVKDATEIKFPIPLGDYKEVFAERDGPLNGSRRKAIVHWVARHLRRSLTGKEFPVKKHTRGVQEFDIDGLHIKLTPNK